MLFSASKLVECGLLFFKIKTNIVLVFIVLKIDKKCRLSVSKTSKTWSPIFKIIQKI